MPIMAAHGRSDARGTARLLAHMALSSIDNPTRGASTEVALNNMYRLLQSFRTDIFFGKEPSADLPQASTERLTLRPPEEQNVRQVRAALQQAIATAFKDQTKDQALEAVEKVLRWIAHPKPALQPSEGDRNKTATFLRELIKRL